VTATLPGVSLAEPGVGDVTVQLDVWPADALLAEVGTTFLDVRTTIADGVVQVWRHEAPGPAVIFTGKLLAASGDARSGWTLATDNGTVITGHSGGCRCGQQLGSANLWPYRRRVNISLY
jgi:hypothetical protein